MTETIAKLLVSVLSIYAGAGLLFGLWFVLRGVNRVDPAARGSTRGWRVLILPGVTALWPLFVLRLARGLDKPPEEHNAHRDAAGGRT